jgi:hypothetical protein
LGLPKQPGPLKLVPVRLKLAEQGRQTLPQKPEEPKVPLAKLPRVAVRPLQPAKAKARAQVLLKKPARVQPSRRLPLPEKRREVWAWPTQSGREKLERREKRPREARQPERARQRVKGLLRAQVREPRRERAKALAEGNLLRLAILWMDPQIWAWPTRWEKVVKAWAPGTAPRKAQARYLLTSQRDGVSRTHGSSTSTT